MAASNKLPTGLTSAYTQGGYLRSQIPTSSSSSTQSLIPSSTSMSARTGLPPFEVRDVQPLAIPARPSQADMNRYIISTRPSQAEVDRILSSQASSSSSQPLSTASRLTGRHMPSPISTGLLQEVGQPVIRSTTRSVPPSRSMPRQQPSLLGRLPVEFPPEEVGDDASLLRYLDRNPGAFRVIASKLGLAPPMNANFSTRQKYLDLIAEYDFTQGKGVHDYETEIKIAVRYAQDLHRDYIEDLNDERVFYSNRVLESSISRLISDTKIPLDRKAKFLHELLKKVDLEFTEDIVNDIVRKSMPDEIVLNTGNDKYVLEAAIRHNKKELTTKALKSPSMRKYISEREIDLAFQEHAWSVIPILAQCRIESHKGMSILPYLGELVTRGRYEVFDELVTMLEQEAVNDQIDPLFAREFGLELQNLSVLDKRETDPRYLLRIDPNNPLVRDHYLSPKLLEPVKNARPGDRWESLMQFFEEAPSSLISEFISHFLESPMDDLQMRAVFINKIIPALIRRNDIVNLDLLTNITDPIRITTIYLEALRFNNVMVSRYFLTKLDGLPTAQLTSTLQLLIGTGNLRDFVMIVNMLPSGTDLSSHMKMCILCSDFPVYRYLRRLEYTQPGRFIINRPSDEELRHNQTILGKYPDMVPEFSMRAGL